MSFCFRILLPTIEFSVAEVEKYADHAAVGDDVRRFNDGFETMIGERGVMLSGGQKQRLSIARALIKDPDIIILDDCLSAVDARTEKDIVDFLEASLDKKTTIMITHRIPHGMQFDKILTLSHGEIAEFGTHDELQNLGGYYSRLLDEHSTHSEPD
jgi:ATP-binding cassette subfamily B protein